MSSKATLSDKEKAARSGYTERPEPPQPSAVRAAALNKKADAAVAAVNQHCDVGSFLIQFGMEAVNDEEWSERQLEKIREERQPLLEIAVTTHEEIESHTWYAIECAISRPLIDFGRAEWKTERRLAHLRTGLHDRIKDLLGQEEYGRLFSSTPFASHMGLKGTTGRLRSWCQTLARCLNSGIAPPKVAAATLLLLDAPFKDAAMIALARSIVFEPRESPTETESEVSFSPHGSIDRISEETSSMASSSVRNSMTSWTSSNVRNSKNSKNDIVTGNSGLKSVGTSGLQSVEDEEF